MNTISEAREQGGRQSGQSHPTRDMPVETPMFHEPRMRPNLEGIETTLAGDDSATTAGMLWKNKCVIFNPRHMRKIRCTALRIPSSPLQQLAKWANGVEFIHSRTPGPV